VNGFANGMSGLSGCIFDCPCDLIGDAFASKSVVPRHLTDSLFQLPDNTLPNSRNTLL
jgi:hypothetical protein